jgi:FdhE protein
MANQLNQRLDSALAAYAAALPRQARLIQLAGEVLRRLADVKAALPPSPGVDLHQTAARLAAGEDILATVPVSAPIFRDTVTRLLELFRQFDLLPTLPPDLLHSLISLAPPAWLGGTGGLEEICQGREVPVKLLFFVGQKALSPFYQQAAAPYIPLFSQGVWQRSVCPGCGQVPVLASLPSDSRQRHLYCSLCDVQWPYARRGCVFCGAEAEAQFSYVFVEDDPARRADLCRVCHRYLKTIVAGRLTHPLYLPMEEFVTVDLDTLLARGDLIS